MLQEASPLSAPIETSHPEAKCDCPDDRILIREPESLTDSYLSLGAEHASMSSEPLSPWFIRHTPKVTVRDQDIQGLYEMRKVGAHFPKVKVRNGRIVRGSTTGVTDAVERFIELGQSGGYVWSEYRTTKAALVGRVEPGTKVKLTPALWSKEGRQGEETALKTLQLRAPVVVAASERMDLRSHRPRRGTISRWPSSGKRLEAIVEGKYLDPEWSQLSTAQQEIVSSEFLRSGQLTELPELERLLLPPGRTLKDIDIYGLASDGKPIFGQVTYKKIEKVGSKIRNLKPYRGKGNHLLFFCRCDDFHARDGIMFIPVERVMKWALEEPNLGASLFPDS